MIHKQSDDMTYVIGCVSYNRPQELLRLLRSLEKLETSLTPTIIIIDNQGESGQASITVRQIQSIGYRFPIRLVGESHKGVAEARNKLLHEAFEVTQADFLAVIDDDETVDKNWFENLVKAQGLCKADIVGGRVAPQFEETPPNWVHHLDIYYADKGKPSGLTDMIWGVGNCLISHRVYNGLSQKYLFDVRLSTTGGEDDDYFMRLHEVGYIFSYCREAVSYEWFSSDRVTLSWAIKRSFRIGENAIRIAQFQNKLSKLVWAQEFIKSFCAVIIGCFGMIVYCLSGQRRIKQFIFSVRHSGKLAQLCRFQDGLGHDG
jgi:succinoglycan biosynthesis protein ExoM